MSIPYMWYKLVPLIQTVVFQNSDDGTEFDNSTHGFKSLLSIPSFLFVPPVILVPPAILVPKPMSLNQLLVVQRRGEHLLDEWCTTLRNALDQDQVDCRVTDMAHMKAKKNGQEHEFLDLTVKWQFADTERVIHLLVERNKQHDGIIASATALIVKKNAIDTITVLPAAGPSYPNVYKLSSLGWAFAYAPKLRILSNLIREASCTHPKYDIILNQCYWFARLVCVVTSILCRPHDEDIGMGVGARSKRLRICGVGGISPKDQHRLERVGAMLMGRWA